jgi:hypothetical protein
MASFPPVITYYFSGAVRSQIDPSAVGAQLVSAMISKEAFWAGRNEAED